MTFKRKTPLPDHVHTRFNKVLVYEQLTALLKKPERAWDITHQMLKEFEALKAPVHLRPRYKDNIHPSHFYDDQPHRILLSNYEEYGGALQFNIARSYGVHVPNKIIRLFGGRQIISRIIAVRGLVGVLEDVKSLPAAQLDALEAEIKDLEHTIALEMRVKL